MRVAVLGAVHVAVLVDGAVGMGVPVAVGPVAHRLADAPGRVGETEAEE